MARMEDTILDKLLRRKTESSSRGVQPPAQQGQSPSMQQLVSSRKRRRRRSEWWKAESIPPELLSMPMRSSAALAPPRHAPFPAQCQLRLPFSGRSEIVAVRATLSFERVLKRSAVQFPRRPELPCWLEQLGYEREDPSRVSELCHHSSNNLPSLLLLNLSHSSTTQQPPVFTIAGARVGIPPLFSSMTAFRRHFEVMMWPSFSGTTTSVVTRQSCILPYRSISSLNKVVGNVSRAVPSFIDLPLPIRLDDLINDELNSSAPVISEEVVTANCIHEVCPTYSSMENEEASRRGRDALLEMAWSARRSAARNHRLHYSQRGSNERLPVRTARQNHMRSAASDENDYASPCPSTSSFRSSMEMDG